MGKKKILPWRRKTLEKVRDAIPDNVSFDAWIIAVETFEASTFNSFVRETEKDLRTGTWDNTNDLAPFVTPVKVFKTDRPFHRRSNPDQDEPNHVRGQAMDWTEVQKLGDKMAGLSKEDAEALRSYLIERYEVLPGCVEGLVWNKHGLKQGRWAKPEARSDFYVEFCQQFIVRAR